ncbi:MAG: PEGA domain-containing protein [Bacteroidota bacterium]
MRILTCATVITLLSLTSCATIFTGSTANLRFDSNVKGAIIEMDGLEVGRTPYTMKVKKSFNGIVTMRAEDYQDKSFSLPKSFNPVAIINLTNIFAWGIDYLTGAMWTFDQKGYKITLEEED